MSDALHTRLNHHDDLAKDPAVEALHAFLDGELAITDQPDLFAHLALCESCRRELEGVMKFRRISRMENLTVPPAVDAAIFKRLQKHKSIMRKVDRAGDRRPLWNVRAPISLRATIITAIMVFLTGLLVPANHDVSFGRDGHVTGVDERIEFPDLDFSLAHTNTLYVFFPGVTIEAASEEVIDSDSP